MNFPGFVRKCVDLMMSRFDLLDLCFVHPIFGFWFLVTKLQKYEILPNLCLHFAGQDGKTEKNGKKIMQLK